MPIVNIDMREGHSASEKKAIAGAIHNSLEQALKVSIKYNEIKIQEYASENMLIHPEAGHKYHIEIKLFAGRSLATKRQLYQAIISNLQRLNIAANDVLIILHEIAMENWGMRGGIPASEVELDYKISI